MHNAPLLLLPLLLGLLWLAAWRYGADSRDGRDRGGQPSTRMPGTQTIAGTAPAGRVSSPAHDLVALGRRLRRVPSALVRFNRGQVDLWESYFRAQRPWDSDWLRWVHGPDGWRLHGRVAPRAPGTGPAAAGDDRLRRAGRDPRRAGP